MNGHPFTWAATWFDLNQTMAGDDYYRILGVDENADTAQIRKAYRELAFRYHPDRNAQQQHAAEKMKAVNEAYAVLSNPAQRRNYDAIRQRYGSSASNRFRQSYSQDEIFRGSDIGQVFEEMARSFGIRGFEEIFKEFYGDGFKHFEIRRNGMTIKGVFFGGVFGMGKRLSNRSIPGQRSMNPLAHFLLDRLSGGRIPRDGKDIQDYIRIDDQTAEKGGPYAYYHRKKDRKLIVNIPPGVNDGKKIRLKHMGENGRSGGRPGDLYLSVRVQRPLVKRIKRYLQHHKPPRSSRR